jgi:hypothetical protein
LERGEERVGRPTERVGQPTQPVDSGGELVRCSTQRMDKITELAGRGFEQPGEPAEPVDRSTRSPVPANGPPPRSRRMGRT